MKKLIKKLKDNSVTFDQDYLDTKYESLTSKGRPGIYFFIMTICSAIITTMGFIMNSPSVIIGAMVISPLLYPIVLAGSAVAQKHWQEASRLLKMLAYGAIVVLFVSSLVSYLIPFEYMSEIQDRLTSSPLQYGIVAVVSGVAGVFAYYWPKVSESLTGVGISVALMPPVVMLGVAIGNSDRLLMAKSAFIVLLNVTGIIVGSILGFISIKANSEK